MVSIGQMLVFAMLTPSAHLETDLEMREPGWPPAPRELPASVSGVLSEINAVLHQDGLVVRTGSGRSLHPQARAGSSARVNARMHSELPGAFPFGPGPAHECESILRWSSNRSYPN